MTGSDNRGQRGTPRLQILAASYGAQDRFADVRQLLQSRVQNDRLDLQVTNASMGGDPIRGPDKTLRINYGWVGRTYEVVVRENQRVSIPTGREQSEIGARSGRWQRQSGPGLRRHREHLPAHMDGYGQQLQGRDYGQGAATALEQATDQLVAEFRQSNRNMRVVRYHEGIRVDGENALSTYLSNDSPIAGGVARPTG